eukprot:364873-Chlamydomonas_euryale.AAC.7
MGDVPACLHAVRRRLVEARGMNDGMCGNSVAHTRLPACIVSIIIAADAARREHPRRSGPPCSSFESLNWRLPARYRLKRPGAPPLAATMADPIASGSGSGPADDGAAPRVRKIRLRKIRPGAQEQPALGGAEAAERDAAVDRRIAELIPGLADLSVGASSSAQLDAAASVRKKIMSREQAHREEMLELGSIYDMSRPHPCEGERPPGGEWSQGMRPRVRKVQLSPYQYEMINYQRMLMRKNIWCDGRAVGSRGRPADGGGLAQGRGYETACRV